MIVFVNGIFGDAVSTWMNDHDCAYWPTLLAGDRAFDDADIYVHSFQSPKLAQAQQIIELAARFRDLLEVDGVLKHKQVVFLAHSMGGLVTRAMLLDARPPASQIPMIYFFATPTAGANVAGIASHLSENPQLKDMLPLDGGGYVKDLLEEWLKTSDESRLNYPNTIASYCAAERLTTWGVLIVPENSAIELCNRETRTVNTNHIEIVKPENARADSYIYFKAAYRRTFGDTAEATAEAINDTIDEINLTKRSVGTSEFDRWFTVATPEREGFKLLVQQIVAKSLEFGCEETSLGEFRTEVKLKPNQRVIEVRPAIGGANIKASWAAVVRHANGEAVIRYSIQAFDRPGCSPKGFASVVVNYVVEQGSAASPSTH